MNDEESPLAIACFALLNNLLFALEEKSVNGIKFMRREETNAVINAALRDMKDLPENVVQLKAQKVLVDLIYSRRTPNDG